MTRTLFVKRILLRKYEKRSWIQLDVLSIESGISLVPLFSSSWFIFNQFLVKIMFETDNDALWPLARRIVSVDVLTFRFKSFRINFNITLASGFTHLFFTIGRRTAVEIHLLLWYSSLTSKTKKHVHNRGKCSRKMKADYRKVYFVVFL
jgi:hypothetical protein